MLLDVGYLLRAEDLFCLGDFVDSLLAYSSLAYDAIVLLSRILVSFLFLSQLLFFFLLFLCLLVSKLFFDGFRDIDCCLVIACFTNSIPQSCAHVLIAMAHATIVHDESILGCRPTKSGRTTKRHRSTLVKGRSISPSKGRCSKVESSVFSLRRRWHLRCKL